MSTSPILAAISQELQPRPLSRSLGPLDEDDHLALYPKISALWEALRELTAELKRLA